MTLRRLRAPALLARCAMLIALLLVLTWGGHLIREALDIQITPDNAPNMYRAMALGTITYIGLLALPFVPGAEIGLVLLVVFGASIAPLVYLATVIAMMLAYMVGRFLPIRALERLLLALHLNRAAALIARAAPLSEEDRLTMLLGEDPKRYRSLVLRYRYLALALAVNAPGNTFIGGGGGIMMMAGLSGIFSPIATLVTIAIAVAPVPLVMVFWGMYF